MKINGIGFNRDIVECKEIKEQLVEEKSNKI